MVVVVEHQFRFPVEPCDGGIDQILLELNSLFLVAMEDFIPSCPDLSGEEV